MVADPDHALYSGGFFSAADKNKMQQVRHSSWQDLATSQFQFSDQRLDELLFRYRARNALESLNAAELAAWQDYRRNQFFEKDSASSLLYDDFKNRMVTLQQSGKNPELLSQLASYVEDLVASLD